MGIAALLTAALLATSAVVAPPAPRPAAPATAARVAALTTAAGQLAPLSRNTTHNWLTQRRLVSDQARFESAEVWVYGDSITVGTAASLGNQVAPQLRTSLAVDAQNSIPTTPATDRLLDRLRVTRNRPRVLVFALGTNDAPVLYPSLAVPNSRPADVWKDLAAVRQVLGSRTSIIFVDTYLNRRYAPTDRVRAIEMANARLINAQARRSRIADAIVPWYAAVAKDERRYLTDGVHPTPAGVDLRTALIMPVLARQFASHPA
ncbi:SGNH/GDSL hydrolase family protein [Arsenicicoccus dermatophilus]|uniref:SGNH/GDSL hydrolase family protein n=1 Tax=Arsenicicoccus dermatophilus TaxID=1076331 RepID=UPI001F4CAA6B|nr:SGNH/GDSL hydrolase family protein [Arsenicicoccus dermatophilus]MCH8612457.1 SGNH/GDSL hydrolase family protein [Arsenicicoccus dermatophilus]